MQDLRRQSPLNYDQDINLQLIDDSEDDVIIIEDIIDEQRKAVTSSNNTNKTPNTNPDAKKGKNWCLTINCKAGASDPNDLFGCLTDQEAQFTVQKPNCNYFVYGREIGEKGMTIIL